MLILNFIGFCCGILVVPKARICHPQLVNKKLETFEKHFNELDMNSYWLMN
jgi:hypothetical protein